MARNAIFISNMEVILEKKRFNILKKLKRKRKKGIGHSSDFSDKEE